MDYKKYIEWAYDIACRHGFHDEEKSPQHYLMLVITEVGEMVEADRKNRHAQVAMFKHESVSPQPRENKKKHWQFCFERFIKDTVEDEMADICIRLFDLCGVMKWEPSRVIDVPTEEGLKNNHNKPFTERAFSLCRYLTSDDWDDVAVTLTLFFLRCLAMSENIDLEWHIAQKMEYNDMRSKLHGKKY